jgi:hypothetical protein
LPSQVYDLCYDTLARSTIRLKDLYLGMQSMES